MFSFMQEQEISLPCSCHEFMVFSRAKLLLLSQVLEDDKQWWRLLNRSGQAGYVPYNILDVVKLEDMEELYNQVMFNW